MLVALVVFSPRRELERGAHEEREAPRVIGVIDVEGGRTARRDRRERRPAMINTRGNAATLISLGAFGEGIADARCWRQTCQLSLFQAMSQIRHS